MEIFNKLSSEEKENLILHLEVCNKLKKVKIIDNLKEYLTTKYPGEYTKKDDIFFNKYAGKDIFVYKYTNCSCDNDWFIVKDDNYPIDINCFINLEEE